MVFKLVNAAAKTWRRLNAGSPGRLIDLVTGSPA
jgi:hypothetical protein